MPEIKNISVLSDCFGCGVCSMVCPVRIIELKETKDGFYQPIITEQSKCIECGLCLKICGFNNSHEKSPDEESYFIGWSKDMSIRKKCSSGGIAQEIVRGGLESGYNICAAAYDVDTRRVRHVNVQKVKDADKFIGSKYIPSDTRQAFQEIDIKRENVVIGTPCQIDSFRRFIRLKKCEDRFILVDFFCHGVPSLRLWDKYIRHIETRIGSIRGISWRNKDQGWKRSYCIKAIGEDYVYQSGALEGDLFYKFFLGNYCLSRCCYESCKYKQSNSSADIRIGDCWGISRADEEDGVSCIISFSDIGDKLLDSLKGRCHMENVKPDVVLKGQMKYCASRPFVVPYVMDALSSPSSLLEIYHKYIRPYEKIVILPKRIWRKAMSIIKKIKIAIINKG